MSVFGVSVEASLLEDVVPVPLGEPESVASESLSSVEERPEDESPEEESALGASARDEGPDELELVVSAKATAGSEAIAMPTPNATASAPTRPTWLE
ncbi:MAG: hypothetical protein ACPGIJ_00345 [Mycobacterium sp.]